MLSYALIDTALGWIGLVGSPAGLCRVFLPQASEAGALHLVTVNYPGLVCKEAVFGDLSDRLRAYLTGRVIAFPDRLDLEGIPPFYRGVLETTHTIPYGQMRSYAWVAHQVGSPRAARAVGQAMARNPVPIVVPCHRVIASDGGIHPQASDCHF